MATANDDAIMTNNAPAVMVYFYRKQYINAGQIYACDHAMPFCSIGRIRWGRPLRPIEQERRPAPRFPRFRPAPTGQHRLTVVLREQYGARKPCCRFLCLFGVFASRSSCHVRHGFPWPSSNSPAAVRQATMAARSNAEASATGMGSLFSRGRHCIGNVGRECLVICYECW